MGGVRRVLADARRRWFWKAWLRIGTEVAALATVVMLAAWSILNKVANKSDARFSDTVLIVCPNVTIRERLGELDPFRGEASLYRTRDLVAPQMMDDLRRQLEISP